jgi:DNA-binding MarR family transcriptional regulator
MSKKVETLFAELFEAAGIGRARGEALAVREGLTQARWQTLWIADTGRLTVPQIARRLSVSRQSVQRVANELTADGMTTFEPNPDHKASPILALTTTGRQALERINIAADHDHQYLLGLFPEHDVDTLSTLLARFTASMKHLHNGAVTITEPPSKVPTTGDG